MLGNVVAVCQVAPLSILYWYPVPVGLVTSIVAVATAHVGCVTVAVAVGVVIMETDTVCGVPGHPLLFVSVTDTVYVPVATPVQSIPIAFVPFPVIVPADGETDQA